MTTGAQTSMIDPGPPIDEVGAFVGSLFNSSADQLTNCRGWTVHNLTAHLAAGAAEQADLIEERIAGRPERPTRTFGTREPAYRALPDDKLRDRLVVEAARFAHARTSLGSDTVAFTGHRMTEPDFAMHGRSECTLHRWDIVGRDDIGWTMLGQDALTIHAVTMMNAMDALVESPANRAKNVGLPDGLRVIVRSEPHDDLVVTMSHGVAALSLEPITDAPADLVLEPAARLLFLWGRREPSAPILLNAQGGPRTLLNRLVPGFG